MISEIFSNTVFSTYAWQIGDETKEDHDIMVGEYLPINMFALGSGKT
jgi:hypothetical protein